MTKNETARAVYARRHHEIGAKLGQIHVGLRAHQGRASKRPADWGFAGDLGRVAELLDQVLGHLGVGAKGGGA